MPSFIPQPCVMWAYHDGNVARVIGWTDTADAGLVPVVWEEDRGANQWGAHPDHPVFLYDTKDEADDEVRANVADILAEAAARKKAQQ